MSKINIKENLGRATRYLLDHAHQAVEAAEYADNSCEQELRRVRLVYPLAFGLHSLAKAQQLTSQQPVQADLSPVVELLEREIDPENKTVNYWQRTSKDFSAQRLPDDVDDTAVAWAALQLAHNETPAEVFINTMAIELQPGGPYRTWYFGGNPETAPKWTDVDPAVNAHFIYLAALNEIFLPNTVKYLAHLVGTQKIKSVYYPTPLMTYLYLCRFLAIADSDSRKTLGKKTKLALESFHWAELDLLEKVLLALCRLYLGMEVPEEWLNEIALKQKEDGSFPALALCHGYNTSENTLTYAGNTYAGTALFAELLVEQLRLERTASPERQQSSVKQQSELIEKTEKLLNLSGVNFPLDELNITNVYKMCVAALELNSTSEPTVNLFAAAVCGWKAYHTLDDIYDKQKSNAELTEFGRLLRLSLYFASQLDEESYEEIQQGYAAAEAFYLWEQKHARFARFSRNIYAKSFSYTYIFERLAVLTRSLSRLTHLANRPELAAPFKKVLETALFLQQMSDDAHDWEEDMRLGIKTYALNHLAGAKQLNARHSYKRIFWTQTLPHIIELCEEKHLAAQTEVEKFPNPTPLKYFLDKSLKPLLEAKAEIAKTQKIISLLD